MLDAYAQMILHWPGLLADEEHVRRRMLERARHCQIVAHELREEARVHVR